MVQSDDYIKYCSSKSPDEDQDNHASHEAHELEKDYV